MWWVYASYVAHEECKGRTGWLMSLGQGAVSILSRKQKIQSKSSKKDKLIGVDDTLPQALCTDYFINTQGCSVDRKLITKTTKAES